MYRVEEKYVLSREHMYILEKRIQTVMKPDLHSGESGYRVSSVYFDDIYDSFLEDTVNGVAERNKYRARIYNDNLERIQLEIKSKKYSRIKKKACSISYKELDALINGKIIDAPLDVFDVRYQYNKLINEFALRPKVIVTYDRKAYASEFGNVRITFDYDLRASNRIMELGNEKLSYEYPNDYDSVLEIKYDEFLPDYIAQVLEINTLIQISNSKYKICREIFKF